MRLLILTQKVDRNDPILGFFHRWVEEFAKNFEKITVICLEEGEHDLPENVRVLSLGKENGRSRFKYIWNFYKYIWKERKNYDVVFVHMNQEYVILGWKFWKLWGKKIYLWRNFPYGTIFTRIAVLLSDKVFCTSPQSYTAQFKKTEIMPVGIDTEFFKPDPSIEKIPNSILFLGRIDEVKRVKEFIEALKQLTIPFKANIYGDPTYPNSVYEKEVIELAKPLVEKGLLTINSSVTNDETKRLYQSHEIYVNLTPSGSFDKTIIEAMASGCLVVCTNEALKGVLPESFIVGDSASCCIKEALSVEDKQMIIDTSRNYVLQKHSLDKLVNRLFTTINS